jgi:hypothetical protein
MEKEHKIINPHNPEKLTINRIDYQPFTIQPREPKKLKAPSPKQYVPMKSSYQSEFQNWGANEIIHEKNPQYPYYSLPFKGNTNYARTFCGGSDDGKTGKGVPFGMDALKQRQNGTGYDPNTFYDSFGGKGGGSYGPGNNFGPGGGYNFTNAHMANSASNLRPLLGTSDVDANFETTNQRNFKSYQIKNRPQTCKPHVEAVRTKGNTHHFQTSHKHDFKRMKYQPPAVDMIPYP